MISKSSAMNARLVIRYDDPKATLSIRSARLIGNMSLIASRANAKKTALIESKSR